MSNQLKNQSSPYLLQHADNPVEWYPWGEEAFEKAKQENKPVFLSIGYSTCHWCHMMAHESFENTEIAEILNRYFVAVKVDREERPDIDSVYMSVCQALTGSGGWPMSIFMTAEQKPFYAGTYFPPKSRYGTVGFYELLLAIADKWENDRQVLLESADNILAVIGTQTQEAQEYINGNLPDMAAGFFKRSFDAIHGGFGRAPKFPTPHNLIFLTLYSHINKDEEAFSQVRFTLEKMRRGGIFDALGYGFSRYSTDDYYLVPHFEKMLYDNALLILAYTAAYKMSGDKLFLDTAEKTAEYIFKEMTGKSGEFYSAQDADSEGMEGKYYVWDYEEICHILGEHKGKSFCEYYGVERQGNFEGKNILNLLNGNEISDKFEREREILYEYRKSRMRLHLDDKVLTSWNSLMICALTALYRAVGNKDYLLAAEKSYKFIEENLMEKSIIYVSWRRGKKSVKGFLDEYAYFTAASISLYEATAEDRYLKQAETACKEAEMQFADEKAGGYFLCGTMNSGLITKPKETYDGALPSGNSVMAYCLVRLSGLAAGEKKQREYQQKAGRQLAFLSSEAGQYPAGHTMFLISLLMYFDPPEKITIVTAEKDNEEALREYLPFYADVRILKGEKEGYKLLNNKTTYYVCRNYTCLPPSNDLKMFTNFSQKN